MSFEVSVRNQVGLLLKANLIEIYRAKVYKKQKKQYIRWCRVSMREADIQHS